MASLAEVRRLFARAGVVGFATILAFAGMTPTALADDATAVSFGDTDLATCVRLEMGLPSNAIITTSDLASLTHLTCDASMGGLVSSLEGLQYATSLETLDFGGRLYEAIDNTSAEARAAKTFTMLAPLANLQHLTYLDIRVYLVIGAIYDLSVLSSLPSLTTFRASSVGQAQLVNLAAVPNLTTLYIGTAGLVTDISPLTSLPHLTSLSVGDLGVMDVSPLASLKDVSSLSLRRADATDLSPLAELPALTTLDLKGAQAVALPSFTDTTGLTDVDISTSNVASLEAFAGSDLATLNASTTTIDDLAPLAANSSLKSLDVSDTAVDNLSPLSGLSKLEHLKADRTSVSDTSPLAHLAALSTLSLVGVNLTSVAPLATAPALTSVDVSKNHITDVSPLAAITHLTTWLAKDQTASIGPLATCEALDVSAGKDVHGTTLYAIPKNLDGGYAFGQTSLILASGHTTVDMVAKSSDGLFNVTLTAPIPTLRHSCAWPSTLYPHLAISGGDAGGSFVATTAWPGAINFTPTVDYSYFDLPSTGNTDPTGWITEGNTIPIVPGFMAGWRFQMNAHVWVPGMDYADLTAETGPAWGVFPELSPTLQGTVTLETGGSIDISSYLNSDAVEGLHISGLTEQYDWYLDGIFWRTTGNQPYVQPLPTSLLGKKLSGTVTLSAPNYHSRTFAAPGGTVVRNFTTDYYLGSIEGSRDVGATLTALPLHWSGLTVSYTYQWARSGVPIPGATGKTYKVIAADAGHTVSYKVTISRSGYETWTDTVSTTIHKPFAAAPTPTISGSTTVGATLTLSHGTWSPTPSAFSYRWYRNGVAISGATKSSYKTTTSDIGKKVTGRVTGTKSGYTSTWRSSASVTVTKKLTAAPTPTISGTAQVKHTLTAHTGTWAPGAIATTYQWYRNGQAISGATHSTYKPGVKDAYATFAVRVTGKKSGYTTESRLSTPKTVVGIDYASCAELRLDYPGGVAKSASTVDLVAGVANGGILGTTFVSLKLYSLNDESDRDKDGWACES